MNCLQNIGKLFAVSVLLAMFAVSYISVERNRNTASEKLADFLYPFQNGKGCSTPSLKLNGSTAQHECRTEGKAAPSFCCSPERQETEMSYTVKTCRWEKHSNPVATPAERNTAENSSTQIQSILSFALLFYLVGCNPACKVVFATAKPHRNPNKTPIKPHTPPIGDISGIACGSWGFLEAQKNRTEFFTKNGCQRCLSGKTETPTKPQNNPIKSTKK